MYVRIVTNHWGWRIDGIRRWIRYAWAWPFDRWSTEGIGRRFKIGPVCFGEGRPE